MKKKDENEDLTEGEEDDEDFDEWHGVMRPGEDKEEQDDDDDGPSGGEMLPIPEMF